MYKSTHACDRQIAFSMVFHNSFGHKNAQIKGEGGSASLPGIFKCLKFTK